MKTEQEGWYMMWAEASRDLHDGPDDQVDATGCAFDLVDHPERVKPGMWRRILKLFRNLWKTFLRFWLRQPSVIVGPHITLSRGPDAGPPSLSTKRAWEAGLILNDSKPTPLIMGREQEPGTYYEHGWTEWTTTDDGNDDG